MPIPFSIQEYQSSLLYYAEESHVDKWKMRLECKIMQSSLWGLILETLDQETPFTYPQSREKYEQMREFVIMDVYDGEEMLMLRFRLRQCLMLGLIPGMQVEWSDALWDLDCILSHTDDGII